MKLKAWEFILIVLLVLALALWAFLPRQGGNTVTVSINGQADRQLSVESESAASSGRLWRFFSDISHFGRCSPCGEFHLSGPHLSASFPGFQGRRADCLPAGAGSYSQATGDGAEIVPITQ